MKETKLTKRTPTSPFTALQTAMNDLFRRFSSEDWPTTGWPEWPHGLMTGTSEFWPSLDVTDDTEAVTITAELPGVAEGDVSVSLTGDVLTIRGEKKDEREKKTKNTFFAERSFGSFTRSLRLPCEIDPDKVLASFKNGVLTIGLPKTVSAREKTKQIDIKKD